MLKAPLAVIHPHLEGKPEQRYLVDALGIHIATGPEAPVRELAAAFNAMTPEIQDRARITADMMQVVNEPAVVPPPCKESPSPKVAAAEAFF